LGREVGTDKLPAISSIDAFTGKCGMGPADAASLIELVRRRFDQFRPADRHGSPGYYRHTERSVHWHVKLPYDLIVTLPAIVSPDNAGSNMPEARVREPAEFGIMKGGWIVVSHPRVRPMAAKIDAGCRRDR
jgi:hypothetical protein